MLAPRDAESSRIGYDDTPFGAYRAGADSNTQNNHRTMTTMTANPTSDHSGSVAAQWPVANAETSTVTLKLHTPGPIPPIGDDDDEDDEDGGRGSGGGGGSIDPDDDDDAPDDDEDDEGTLWADGPIRVIV